MSLYLSRLALNPRSRESMRLAGDPQRVHGMLCHLFERQGGRVLFRVEEGPVVLVQSETEPDWARLPLSLSDLNGEPGTKPLDLEGLKTGDALAFRLLARPVRRARTGSDEPGPRRDLRTDEERLEWLRRKGSDSGFQVISCDLTLYTLPAVKSTVPYRETSGSFTAVRFDGELVVSDPDRLRRAVANGIGTQKAFGLGLVSLARPERGVL